MSWLRNPIEQHIHEIETDELSRLVENDIRIAITKTANSIYTKMAKILVVNQMHVRVADEIKIAKDTLN